MKCLSTAAVLSLALAATSCDSSSGTVAKAPTAPADESVSEPGSTPSGDVALAACKAFMEANPVNKELGVWKSTLDQPPLLPFDPEKTYYWLIETNHGNMKIRLMPDVAPMHVSSTIYLSEIGFYDGLTFHRIIPGFMAQGGCPDGNGRGNPGYAYAGEFDANVMHDRPGLLSMANAGPNTDGSQFFLTFTPQHGLNGKHTIFGEVVEGMEALTSLESIGTRGGPPSGDANMIKTSISVE